MIVKTINSVKKRRKKRNKWINYKKILFPVILIIISIFLINNSNKFDRHASNESAKSQLSTSNIVGADNRERVTPTTSYPWSAIVKLYMTWGTDIYIGSGAMIDKNHVLTAGHCVYSHS